MKRGSCGAAALLFLAGSASAQSKSSDHAILEAVTGGTSRVGGERVAFSQFPVAGILSGDGPGAPINQVFFLNMGPGVAVNGIGWDVDLESFGSSWRSEIGVLITDSTGLGGFNLRPGTDDSPGGPTNYNSGGEILYLANYGIPDVVARADGLIRLEFFEAYDDAPGAADGRWVGGNLFFPIPAPASAGLLGLAGVGALRRTAKRAVHTPIPRRNSATRAM